MMATAICRSIHIPFLFYFWCDDVSLWLCALGLRAMARPQYMASNVFEMFVCVFDGCVVTFMFVCLCACVHEMG